MQFDKERLTELTLKAASGHITPVEWEELNAFLDASPENRLRFETRITKLSVQEKFPLFQQWNEGKDRSRQKMLDYLTNDRVRFFPLWKKLSIAASVLVILGSATLFSYFNSRRPGNHRQPVSAITHIAPGSNKAVLYLGNGSKIILDSSKKVSFGGGSVNIDQNRAVVSFDITALHDTATSVADNTLSTPAGSQYEVVLPDGSRVWLNAASSLVFPSRFSGPLRRVSLTGEAYFEVTKNKEKPFQVTSGDLTVNVLGTHFNINAYTDNEAVRTSLLEGSVRITKGGNSDLLAPGQQAVVDRGAKKINIINANLDQVMAWKNGLFHFEGADIHAIMSEIGHWYDMEIVYSDKVPTRNFEGKISRNAELSEVLKILKLSNVKFSVEGKKIIVE
jgi:ferric-dicitrate binding protein FerR (iron transport regulator)